MTNEIPEDCELLMLYAPTADISEEEKERILSYMSEGGKVFIILGEMEGDAPNLDALLNEYGMRREEGYIADMRRNCRKIITTFSRKSQQQESWRKGCPQIWYYW